MTDETAEARVGTVIDGRYKIVELMAAGSMGSVYKAERVPVGKLVAIKFLHASYAVDKEFQARFERETRVMSKLNHPNCVSVLDFGVWENAPYLVMDYVAGTTLRAIVDNGPLPAPRALAVARQMAAGLAHAHAQDIVHRDIKPANVMITDEIGHGERVRILDFGLARLRGNVGRDATQTNLVVGTPNYMAPEQTVPGATIDARADIYAVGVVLYEMVVGDRPFHAEDTLQLLGMHRAAPIPRIADRVKDDAVVLPVGLQELIDRAMAKAPDERYQTAIELAQAIDDVIFGKVKRRETEPTLIAPPGVPIAGTLRRSGPTAHATTQLSVDSSNVQVLEPQRKRSWLGFFLLVVGGVGMAGYLVHRGGQQSVATQKHLDATRSADGAVAASDDAPVVQAVGSDVVPIDAQEIDAAIDAQDVDAAIPDAPEAGSGSAAGSNVEEDPNTAEDLDPAAKGPAAVAEDEAVGAPQTREEVEKKAPVAPTSLLAPTVAGAVQQIKDGKRKDALDSLRALWKKQPQSSYIPFLLGNLYYDEQWWGVAMDHYKAAIDKNRAYRNNPTINRNVIQMLSSPKTRSKAWYFLSRTVGSPARPYVRYAAEHSDHPVIKRQAKALLRYIR